MPLSIFLMAWWTSSLDADTPRWLYLSSFLIVNVAGDVLFGIVTVENYSLSEKTPPEIANLYKTIDN